MDKPPVSPGNKFLTERPPSSMAMQSPRVKPAVFELPYFSSPTGTVTFTDNGNALNTVLINTEGLAEYTTGTLAVGAHSIAASYSGDSSYNKSTGTPGTVAFTVVKGATQVAVSSAVGTIAQGQTTTLTALIETDGAGVAPTGSVGDLPGRLNHAGHRHS